MPRSPDCHEHGRLAEERALHHLQQNGLIPLTRNYCCRLGEIDLIMRDRDEVVIVEVRSRSAGAAVDAPTSITRGKQKRIIAATRHWLGRHPQFFEQPLRFDVVAFDGAKLRWLRNAFEAI